MTYHDDMTSSTLTQPCVPLELAAKRDRLLEVLRSLGPVAVAFSGGIDSTVVAQAARLALGDSAVAVTADSPSVPRAEIEDARRLAERIGIRHRVVPTTEFHDANYVRNDGSRCYFCKSELYSRIETLLPELGVSVICSGANLDDTVRALALAWGLPTWDKPASPCLSSRLAPGVEVTPERTARVEEAEKYLHALGYRECRVRLHADELARIEVPVSELHRLLEPAVHRELVRRFLELGFRYVTLDLEGFRSGSLNQLVSLELQRLFSGQTS